MSGNRVLNFAAVAGIASVVGMAAPAAATEITGTGEVRMSRTSTVANRHATRRVPAMTLRDRRQDWEDRWIGRQFVLMLGVAY